MESKKDYTNLTCSLLNAVQETEAVAPEGYRLNPLYIEKRTKRLQLVLKPSLYEAAKAAAARQGISLNELFNRLLETAVKGDN